MLGKLNNRNLSSNTEDITLEKNVHLKKESKLSVGDHDQLSKGNSDSHLKKLKDEVCLMFILKCLINY